VAKIDKQSYRRPPITEAVIGIRIVASVVDKAQQKVVGRLKGDYPHSQPLREVRIKLGGTEGPIELEHKSQGYRLTNDDQTDVVLVVPDGVTIARLAPYPGWEGLRDRAQAVWKTWRDLTPHHAIARIGIRYINRIDIPVDRRPSIRLEDYIKLHPQIPPIGSGPILGYMMQVTLPTHDPKWRATITSAQVMPPPVPEHMSLLLDVDVSRTEDFSVNDGELWSVIDQARDIKNAIFEGCITDKARRLFYDE
jgi:uncharacterized protein (TIGR04255 family)